MNTRQLLHFADEFAQKFLTEENGCEGYATTQTMDSVSFTFFPVFSTHSEFFLINFFIYPYAAEDLFVDVAYIQNGVSLPIKITFYGTQSFKIPHSLFDNHDFLNLVGNHIQFFFNNYYRLNSFIKIPKTND